MDVFISKLILDAKVIFTILMFSNFKISCLILYRKAPLKVPQHLCDLFYVLKLMISSTYFDLRHLGRTKLNLTKPFLDNNPFSFTALLNVFIMILSFLGGKGFYYLDLLI